MFLYRSRILKPTRTISTLVSDTGRKYIPEKLLMRHPMGPAYDIYLSHCNGKRFVLKPVHGWIFDHLHEFKTEFGNNPRLRNHVDENRKKNVLVYKYFKTDLRELVEKYPPLTLETRKAILKEVGLVLKDMHTKNWVHLDVKPDNVFLDISFKSGPLQLEKVALGDMDCALNLEGRNFMHGLTGSLLWRSPEGQLAKGVGKPSEVFSFGLLCLFVITGCNYFDVPTEEVDAAAEAVILYRHLLAFGPLPDALVKHVNEGKAGPVVEHLYNEEAGSILELFQKIMTRDGAFDPLEQWSDKVFPNLDSEAKRFISRMTNLDPAKRATMLDIMNDPYWN